MWTRSCMAWEWFLLLISKLLLGWKPYLSQASSNFSTSTSCFDELSSCNIKDDDEWEESYALRLFSSWTTSLPCVDRGDNSSNEETRERGVYPTHVDALWMVGHMGEWGEEEVSIWMSALTSAHSRSELDSTWENNISHDVFRRSSPHTEAWEWWQPKAGGWSKELIMHDVSPRLEDWESIKNGSSLSWWEPFWNIKEGLIVSSPSCSSACVMRLPCTWPQFEPTTWESRECAQLTYETDWSSEPWHKESWLVDDGGWQRCRSDSRLRLWMVISSCEMEEWVFTIGFLSHSGISSTGAGDGWEDELGTCCENFSALRPLWGGTHYTDFLALRTLQGAIYFETRKGGGQGRNRVLGSSSAKWGDLWSTRVEGEGKLGGSLCRETWTKRFNSWLMKSGFTNHSGISWQRWRKQVAKSSIDFPGFILKREILS